MGTPAHFIEKEVDQSTPAFEMFSSNYTLYGDLSKRVMDTIGTFVPSMEIYSIDEAFVDLSGIKFNDLEKLATLIRTTVKKHVGIPVTIGIAKTKTLAKNGKQVCKKTKKNIGVHVLNSDAEVEEVLKFTSIGDVWGLEVNTKKCYFSIQYGQRLNFQIYLKHGF